MHVTRYHRMCSLAVECVLLLQNVFSCYRIYTTNSADHEHRMCSLTIECVPCDMRRTRPTSAPHGGRRTFHDRTVDFGPAGEGADPVLLL
jgi:hypothetical protein